MEIQELGQVSLHIVKAAPNKRVAHEWVGAIATALLPGSPVGCYVTELPDGRAAVMMRTQRDKEKMSLSAMQGHVRVAQDVIAKYVSNSPPEKPACESAGAPYWTVLAFVVLIVLGLLVAAEITSQRQALEIERQEFNAELVTGTRSTDPGVQQKAREFLTKEGQR